MREIRPYGSARGVRSNPYPYRDPILPMRSMAPLLTLPFFHTVSRRNRPRSAIRPHSSPRNPLVSVQPIDG